MDEAGKTLPLSGVKAVALTCGHSPLDERIAFKQAVSLQNLGCEVTVIALESPDPGKAPPGMRFLDLGGKVSGRYKPLLRLRRLAREAVRCRADVYIAHEPHTALAAMRGCHKIGAKLIFDSHEFWEEGIASRLGGWRGRLVRWLIRRGLYSLGRRADWVTVVSPPMQRFYSSVRNDGRVDILYNSPRLEDFLLCHQSDRAEMLVVHDGNVNRGRGIGPMLDALALARAQAPVKLLLVGRLETDCQDFFQEKVQSLGLSGAVEVTNWLPYDQVGANLSRGQVGIVALQPTPNNFQGLGNKIFNYMCCGQACVVPAGSATADLVRQVDCGLAVDTTNPREIAQAWITLAKDGALRRRLGANGRRAVEQEFGWHHMEEKLMHIVLSLLGRKNG